MTKSEYLVWLDGWECADKRIWKAVKQQALAYWNDCPEFRKMVRCLVRDGQPELVLCWVMEHM